MAARQSSPRTPGDAGAWEADVRDRLTNPERRYEAYWSRYTLSADDRWRELCDIAGVDPSDFTDPPAEVRVAGVDRPVETPEPEEAT